MPAPQPPTITRDDIVRHLDHAVRDGVRIVKFHPERPDVALVESGEHRYIAGIAGCTCLAGRRHRLCKHRSLVAAAIGRAGELVTSPN